ncbi:MAG: hypothetical protein LBM96_04335 [Methanobrevibacter sp.]|jgi:predicted transport protein|nr:hypothetical protein [Candidatus Methanoflexus mossambicus]
MLNENQKSKINAIIKSYFSLKTPNEHTELNDRRNKHLSELNDLIQRYLEEQIDLNNFKTKIDSHSKKNDLFGFKGTSGQMFFNMLFNNVEKLDKIDNLNLILNNVLKCPNDIDDAKNKIKQLLDFNKEVNNKVNEKKKHGKNGSIPFFLSYFWNIQNNDIWPIYYDSLRKGLKKLGIIFNKDIVNNYIDFYNINNEIKENYKEKTKKDISLWEIEYSFVYDNDSIDLDSDNGDGNESNLKPAINKIYYGAPGTGKSYTVNKKFPNYQRITFHPEYTYFDFVGGLKPVVDENGDISYSFVPGQFTKVLLKSYRNKNKEFGLIIEEINRANTAAVFGDVFQLLDRDETGKSEYSINNIDLVDYLSKQLDLTDHNDDITNEAIINEELSEDEKSYLEDKDASKELIELYKKLRNEILKWNENNIQIGVTKSYIGFKLITIFSSIFVTSGGKLGFHIIVRKNYNFKDPKNIAKYLPRAAPKTYSVYILPSSSNEDIKYILKLIKQAHGDKWEKEAYKMKNISDNSGNNGSVNKKFDEELINELNEGKIRKEGKIRIPKNFSLVATMNSADQGVFVMDSAFKRRWEFEYIPIDFGKCKYSTNNIAGFDVEWGDFAEKLNKKLSKLGISEDRLIAPYFLKKSDLNDKDKVASKLLIYLWDDVVRYNRDGLFKKKFNQFSDLVKTFKNNEQIFVNDLHSNINDVNSNGNNKSDEESNENHGNNESS